MAPGGSDAAAGTIGARGRPSRSSSTPTLRRARRCTCGTATTTRPLTVAYRRWCRRLIGTASQPITIRNYPGEVPVFPNASGQSISCAATSPGAPSVRTTLCSTASGSPAAHPMTPPCRVRQRRFACRDGVPRQEHHDPQLLLQLAPGPVEPGPSHRARRMAARTSPFEDYDHHRARSRLGSAAMPSWASLPADPMPRNILIQRCIFHDWYRKAIQL